MHTPDDLLKKINELKKNKDLKHTVEKRIWEFEELGQKGNKEWFVEMAFCILTANCSAQSGIKIQKTIGKDFLTDSTDRLAARMKGLGYRFPNTRAKFIVSARKHWNIKDIIHQKNSRSARRWIIEHVKGLGWKESSHFLRNVGYKDVAIIDRHILWLMAEYGLIERVPKSVNRRFYLESEEKLERLAERAGLNLAELDLYLWYMKTGKILK
jgi:N-glycosylase/DNA lyase